ncbi:MAG: peptidoglycan DD-metalloendopeptidase family protein [Armatimonadota bacterium]
MNNRIFALFLVLAIATTIIASAAFGAAIKMSSGFYYPTERTWTGTNGGSAGDPRQPWNDGSPGGRIYGYLDSAAPSALGKNHVGMDIRTPYSNPVYAISAGTIQSYYNSGDSRYWCIIVKHRMANGSYFYAVYGHCRMKSGYSTGKSIAAGENFAYINESVNQHIHFGIKMNNNFSTGWGHLALGKDANSIGWRPPRTWLLANAPYGSSGGGTGGDTDDPTSPADTTAPAISIAGPNSNNTISWTITDSGSGVATVTTQWDSGSTTTVAASGSVQVPSTAQKFTIRATDKAGNTATKTVGPFNVQGMIVTVASNLFKDGFYAQQLDGSEGVRIQYGSGGGPDVAEGNLIVINSSGTATANGERYLTNANISVTGSASLHEPIKVSVPDLKVSVEAVDVGLLVTVTGKVTYLKSDGTAFYVDDDTGVNDGFHTGIRVVCDGFTDGSLIAMPKLGSSVTVVGIYSRATVQTKIVPTIRLRYKEDITVW